MSSTHHGRADTDRIDCTGHCGNDATAVVVYEDGEALPRCSDCATVDVEYGYREYPLDAFYEPDPGPRACSTVDYDGCDRIFELFEPDGDAGSWVKATNSEYASRDAHIDLEDYT